MESGQFRYSQPPSKVLHLRNLPWECVEEELLALCNPFGKVVSTKCNVGANRNQAFVEFADVSQAISMISYFASSSEPAQVRGKTVYLQYSNRLEIVHSKNPGDLISNVLLVTIEGVEAGDVSIDVLHLVFSAFGFVHKIATFEKTAGFQALVQYSDAPTATAAREALDGRSIPSYLLLEHVGPCHLRISFSAHTNLNVKFQSHRSRDYTNPYLPVAPSAINGTGQAAVVGSDGKKKEAESNVLLASIENMQYAVTVDVLHTVFSSFGTVQKIAMFEKNGGFQALVQYADIATAVSAKEALEGHCIYEGGYCQLHLSHSHHTDLNVKVNNDRSRDYTLGKTGGDIRNHQNQASVVEQPSALHFSFSGSQSGYPSSSRFTGNEAVQQENSYGRPWGGHDSSLTGPPGTDMGIRGMERMPRNQHNHHDGLDSSSGSGSLPLLPSPAQGISPYNQASMYREDAFFDGSVQERADYYRSRVSDNGLQTGYP